MLIHGFVHPLPHNFDHLSYPQGWRYRRAWGPTADLKVSKKGKWGNMGYFQATKLLKLAFLSLLNKEMLCKGFFHDFSNKKCQLQGALPTNCARCTEGPSL